MLLTCPNCRSGLQVPDGTTALVRCPACKNIFSPAEDAAPEEEEVEEGEEEEDRPKSRRPASKQDDDRPRPKRRRARDEEEDEEERDRKPGNRDFDPVTEEEDRRRKRRRRSESDEKLSPEEKAVRRAAFKRAAAGARLIWISLALFMLSMLLILIFFLQSAFIVPMPIFITLAGVLGLINWILAAVGVGLCLSGPRSPGMLGYGISAAVTVAVHLLFVLVLVAQGRENSIGQTTDEVGTSEITSTLSTSIHWRATFTPMSGLF